MHLRTIIAATVFGIGLAATAASADELKAGYSLPPTSHYGVGVTAMNEELTRLSNGKWTIKQFPANALGGEREMVEGAQIGTVDIVATSTGPVGNFVPDTLVTDIPFLFKDYKHAHAVLDGPIGQKILDQFPKHGLIALAWGENGFRNLTNSKKPVKTPEDAKGLKIRTMENQVHMTAFKTLGVLPTPMAFPELFTAMQQGTVDGQENPIGVILGAKFSQVQKYLTVSQHVYSPALIILSPSVWNKLSDQEKGWFKQAALAGAKAMRQKAEDDAANGIEELKKQGMEVTPGVDATAFQAALKPAYDEYAKKFGQAKIDEIRNYKY
ncbi:TRAP transporter substrate-binding protein [Azospirillum sp. TSO22-1]|uniref:TRAP transporter substrate-binding protein n=1 Tax=Azospirillum sp. TSO22-1 TaxID=716789 RepID=UPI000D61F59B|nr:TRAP transporter substrate-binding protein [Azospirillum sp. TSO22-1]PWC31881.1 C4-dicarboxylate ABC transporter substrate-binding protein [Azospirillum sp. TSO22-1]